MRISALVPAFNEADRVADTLRAVREIRCIAEIICVDDGSTDGTAETAAHIDGVRVIRMEQNCGKGEALNRGMREARGEILLLLDADLGCSAQHAAALIDPVVCDEADMTIAVLPRARHGGAGIVVRAARLGVFRATGRWFPAPLSGQRAIKRWVIEKVAARNGAPFEERYGVETAMDIDACKVGARILEVPLPIAHRELGKTASGWKHRARQLWDIYHALHARL